MNAEHRSATATNLSYVLHEPSTSRVVGRFQAALEKEIARANHRLERLSRMSDANLRERLVVERLSIPPPSESRTSGQILSLKVGAWRLLPRILAVAGLLPDRGNVSFLDDDRCDCTVPVTLFRASAALCLPGSGTYTGAAFAFAVAVLRPGGDTILVRFEPFDEDTATHGAPHRIPARALNLTEKTIREFVLQWACRRPLWDRPAEESLPEFKAMVNGTKQCGR